MAKKTKLTGAQFKDVVAQAAVASGYDQTSPIWGKRTNDVLGEAYDLFVRADELLRNGDGYGLDLLGEGRVLINELQKRLAKGALISAATK